MPVSPAHMSHGSIIHSFMYVTPTLMAALHLQLLAADQDARWLEEKGLPTLQYKFHDFATPHAPEDLDAFLSNFKGTTSLLAKAPRDLRLLAAACDAMTGNSSIMAKLQVIAPELYLAAHAQMAT